MDDDVGSELYNTFMAGVATNRQAKWNIMNLDNSRYTYTAQNKGTGYVIHRSTCAVFVHDINTIIYERYRLAKTVPIGH